MTVRKAMMVLTRLDGSMTTTAARGKGRRGTGVRQGTSTGMQGTGTPPTTAVAMQVVTGGDVVTVTTEHLVAMTLATATTVSANQGADGTTAMRQTGVTMTRTVTTVMGAARAAAVTAAAATPPPMSQHRRGTLAASTGAGLTVDTSHMSRRPGNRTGMTSATELGRMPGTALRRHHLGATHGPHHSTTRRRSRPLAHHRRNPQLRVGRPRRLSVCWPRLAKAASTTSRCASCQRQLWRS